MCYQLGSGVMILTSGLSDVLSRAFMSDAASLGLHSAPLEYLHYASLGLLLLLFNT